ncbi:MAG TPA: hypothetical protein VF104_08995, partial [Burkholderiales bacterium]
MIHPKLKTLVAAIALAATAPAALAQPAGGQEMDHSQHQMQGGPGKPGADKPGMKKGEGMGGLDHGKGEGGMGCGMMGGKG